MCAVTRAFIVALPRRRNVQWVAAHNWVAIMHIITGDKEHARLGINTRDFQCTMIRIELHNNSCD